MNLHTSRSSTLLQKEEGEAGKQELEAQQGCAARWSDAD
jgi:hypothetical protein